MAFGECIRYKRCYVPQEPLHLKAEACTCSEKTLHHARKHKNVQESCQSRGAKLFNWFMRGVTTGRQHSHRMGKQMVRDRGLASEEAAGNPCGQGGQLSWV